MKKLVKEVLEIPTAPLHEGRVAAFIVKKARAWGYAVRTSPKGNLLVGSRAALRRPHCIITAHMDHPGIRLLSVQGRRGVVGILGGVPQDFLRGSRWRLWSEGATTTGVIGRATPKKWMGNPTYHIRLHKVIARGAFCQLHLPSPTWRGDIVSSRAMDNVINVATLMVLLKSQRHNKSARFLALFTRAEEIGMVGASEAIASGSLPKKAPIIVLEASSAKAGKVKMGGGPVLRVGDKCSSFNPDVDLWLQQAALRASRHHRKFSVQRALMSGGTCEATVYNLNGYTVGSLALPLKNYHNRGATRLTAEQIHWPDFLNLQRLLTELIRTPYQPRRIRHTTQRRFQVAYQRWRRSL